MNEEIKDQLSKEEPGEFHDKLLTKARDLVNMSRRSMSKNYDAWDKQALVYDAERQRDKDDKAAAQNKEPQKFIVPFSTAQVNTFIAAAFLLLNQRKNFYEFDPQGAEDYALRDVDETIISHDLKYNKFGCIVFQLLLDFCRFGLCITKSGWVEEKVWVKLPKMMEVDGVEVAGNELEYQKVESFHGNKIVSVSPYHWFPDTRFPVTRFEEGEFCADEFETSRVKLRERESFGEVAGIEHVNKFTAATLQKREGTRWVSIDPLNLDSTGENIMITEIEMRIVPDEFEMDNGKKLGPETHPVSYLLEIANDQRIIRLVEANKFHSKFNYDCAQATPDQHKQLSKSLTQLIGGIQEVVDWIINARITSVKRTLDNQLVVDPSGVDMKTVTNRSRIIQLRRNVGRGGIDRYIKQLTVQDTTANHFNDANQLLALGQMVTGVNDAAMGQAQTGRRSSFEMRAVTQGAASRIVLSTKLLWEQLFDTLGHKLLLNSRQNLDPEPFFNIVGDATPELVAKYQQYSQGAQRLIGKSDFFVFDGTMPSEKAYLAQTLQELVTVLMSNPEAAAMSGLNIQAMIQEIFELRGATDLGRFKNTPEQQQQAIIQNAIRNSNPTGQPPVMGGAAPTAQPAGA